jgi:hypothetical protein
VSASAQWSNRLVEHLLGSVREAAGRALLARDLVRQGVPTEVAQQFVIAPTDEVMAAICAAIGPPDDDEP